LGDFANLQLALRDDRVTDGMTILVEYGTYEYSEAPIVIYKSLGICGASRTGTILRRSDYGSAVVIMAHDVSLANLTVSQGPSVRSLLYLEYEPTIQVGGLTRFDNFRMADVEVGFSIVGITLKANDFVLVRISLVQTEDRNRGFGVVMYGTRGNCRIESVHYEGAELTPFSMFTLEMDVVGEDDNEGSLTIANSTTSGQAIVFFHQVNFYGSVGSYTLAFHHNTIEDADYFVKLTVTGSVGTGDVFDRIEAVGNCYDNYEGNGLITIEAEEFFRSTSLPLIARDNVIPLNAFRPQYPEAEGSSGSICRFFNSHSLIPITIELVE